jgi:hypothetical protein
MPTRIVFTAPGVTGGVLTQVFVEDPDKVFEALAATGGLPFTLTARTRREEAVYVNPSNIAYWTTYTPSRARAGEKAATSKGAPPVGPPEPQTAAIGDHSEGDHPEE